MSTDTVAPRVFAITGGSSGLGRAAVEWVLAQGDIAVNLDLAQHSEESASNEHFVRCDVRSSEEVNQAFEAIRVKFGRLDDGRVTELEGWLAGRRDSDPVGAVD